jgi:hypothetical protein
MHIHRAGRFMRVATLALAAFVATFIAVAVAPLTASAATGGPATVSAAANLPHSDYHGSVTYLGSTAAAANVESAGAAGSVTPGVTGNGSSITASHQVSICPQSCGNFYQDFNTYYTVDRGVFTSCFDNVRGNGQVRWLGLFPTDANTMTLDSSIWVAGVGISVSAGTSINAGVSITANTINFSETHTDIWQMSHSFTNASFCTHLGMTGPYQNSRDSATFGTHTYTDFIN